MPLAKSAFLRHILTLLSGAAVAQLIPLLVSPLLTRWYSPTDVGLQAVYLSWLSSLAVLATARYEMAIVLPAEAERASNLMALSLGIACACALLLVVLLLLIDTQALAQQLGAVGLAPWLWLLPLSLLLAGAMQAWSNWNNRQRHYRANAQGRMAQAFSTAAVQLTGGWLGAGSAGLILGQLAGQLGSLAAQIWQDVKTRFAWWPQVSRAGMREVAIAYQEFPKINTPHALSTALLEAATLLLLARLAGAAAVGYYGLMMRVLKLPAALIGQAVAQVAYRELAEARQQQQLLQPILRKMMLLLCALALPPFILMQIAGEPLFAWVFGQQWATAGRYAQAMSLYILLHFIASPLGMVPLVINRQRSAFLWSLLHALLLLGCLALGFSVGLPLEKTLQWISLVFAAYFLSYFIWLYRASR
ncbi:oligosaccharide flippase family protein [Neisseriaceae bacterium TC5R-5]|nr:oligosaccharide flippase family protein [Neisseriaceae bacterium TC5R-5]